jgi:hypothetical protein
MLKQHVDSAVSGILSNLKTSQTSIQDMRRVASLLTSKPLSAQDMQLDKIIHYGALYTRLSNRSSGSADYVVARQIASWFWCPSSLAI